jgi:hypothetical protein
MSTIFLYVFGGKVLKDLLECPEMGLLERLDNWVVFLNEDRVGEFVVEVREVEEELALDKRDAEEVEIGDDAEVLLREGGHDGSDEREADLFRDPL